MQIVTKGQLLGRQDKLLKGLVILTNFVQPAQMIHLADGYPSTRLELHYTTTPLEISDLSLRSTIRPIAKLPRSLLPQQPK